MDQKKSPDQRASMTESSVIGKSSADKSLVEKSSVEKSSVRSECCFRCIGKWVAFFWQPIGSALLMLVMYATVLIWVPGMMLTAWMPARWMFYWVHVWGKLMRACLWLFCGIRVRIEGREHLPEKPCIYFVKHQSAFETFVLPGILPRHVFVLKQELINIPIFGWGLRLLRSIAINRRQGIRALKEVVSQGKNRLARGFSIVIFPEGTRVAVGTSPEFHKSGALLAKGVGADVVPIAHNAGLLWPRRNFIKQRGCITIRIGKPISVDENTTVEGLNHTIYGWMKTQMEELESSTFHSSTLSTAVSRMRK